MRRVILLSTITGGIFAETITGWTNPEWFIMFSLGAALALGLHWLLSKDRAP